MPIPLAVAAGISAGVPAILKVTQSIQQANQAKRLEEKYDRPVYEIPDELLEAENLIAQQAARSDIPGQAYVEEQIDRSSTNTLAEMIRVSDNPGDILNRAMQLNQNRNDQIAGLGVQGAQMKRDAQFALADFQRLLASYRDKEFEYNENAPYQAAMASASALRGASNQNLNSGLTDLSGGLSQVMLSKYALDQNSQNWSDYINSQPGMAPNYERVDMAPMPTLPPPTGI